MQFSHCDRNRRPPPPPPPTPFAPMALSPTTYPPLLQFVSFTIRGPGHPLLYSTLSLHTTSPPTYPPTHPPLNTPLTYGVIRLPTGELPAATLPGLNGVVTKVDLSMWSGTLNWSRPQTLGPATKAPYPSPTQY